MAGTFDFPSIWFTSSSWSTCHEWPFQYLANHKSRSLIRVNGDSVTRPSSTWRPQINALIACALAMLRTRLNPTIDDVGALSRHSSLCTVKLQSLLSFWFFSGLANSSAAESLGVVEDAADPDLHLSTQQGQVIVLPACITWDPDLGP